MLDVNVRFKKKKYNLSFNAEVVLKHLDYPEMHVYKKIFVPDRKVKRKRN